MSLRTYPEEEDQGKQAQNRGWEAFGKGGLGRRTSYAEMPGEAAALAPAVYVGVLRWRRDTGIPARAQGTFARTGIWV